MFENKFYSEITFPKAFLAKYGSVIRSKVGHEHNEIVFIHMYFDGHGMPVSLENTVKHVIHKDMFERRYPVTMINDEDISLLLPVNVVLYMERAFQRFNNREHYCS